MTPLILLNWRIWAALVVAVALAASHWKAYHMGGASCRAEMAEQTLKLTNDALAASEQNRKTEQTLNEKVRKVSNDYATEKAAHLLTSRKLGDSLRDFTATLDSATAEDAASATSAAGRGGLEFELLGNCAKTLVSMAEEADRLENKVVGLQEYVKSVGLDK